MPVASPARVKTMVKERGCFVDTYLTYPSQYVAPAQPPSHFFCASYDRHVARSWAHAPRALVALAGRGVVFFCAKDRGEGSLGGKGSGQLGDGGVGCN